MTPVSERAGWTAYAGVAVIDSIAAAAGIRRLRLVSKPALMPLLAAIARSRAGDRTPPPVLAALALSGAGDIALLGRGRRSFLAGMAGFLGAHAAYAVALGSAGTPGQGLLRRRPWLVAPFVLVWAWVVRLLWPRLDTPEHRPLRLPIAGYAAAVTGMGAIAVDASTRLPDGRGTTAAAGGLLFVVSDGLLALGRFGGRRRPLVDGAVMATYTAAQALLTDGLTPRR